MFFRQNRPQSGTGWNLKVNLSHHRAMFLAHYKLWEYRHTIISTVTRFPRPSRYVLLQLWTKLINHDNFASLHLILGHPLRDFINLRFWRTNPQKKKFGTCLPTHFWQCSESLSTYYHITYLLGSMSMPKLFFSAEDSLSPSHLVLHYYVAYFGWQV